MRVQIVHAVVVRVEIPVAANEETNFVLTVAVPVASHRVTAKLTERNTVLDTFERPDSGRFEGRIVPAGSGGAESQTATFSVFGDIIIVEEPAVRVEVRNVAVVARVASIQNAEFPGVVFDKSSSAAIKGRHAAGNSRLIPDVRESRRGRRPEIARDLYVRSISRPRGNIPLRTLAEVVIDSRVVRLHGNCVQNVVARYSSKRTNRVFTVVIAGRLCFDDAINTFRFEVVKDVIAFGVRRQNSSGIFVDASLLVQNLERDDRSRNSRLARLLDTVVVEVLVHITGNGARFELAKIVVNTPSTLWKKDIRNLVVSAESSNLNSEDCADRVLSVVIFRRLRFTNDIGATGFERIKFVVSLVVRFLRSDKRRRAVAADDVKLDDDVSNTVFINILLAVIVIVFIDITA